MTQAVTTNPDKVLLDSARQVVGVICQNVERHFQARSNCQEEYGFWDNVRKDIGLALMRPPKTSLGEVLADQLPAVLRSEEDQP